MDKTDNARVDLDTSGLRNRLISPSSNANKENHSDENEFEFEEPSLISATELDTCEKDDSKNESLNLIDFSEDNPTKSDANERKKLVSSNGEHSTTKRNSLKSNSPKAKFGSGNNYFRFNFQMPKSIKTPDKVDENKENFLTETVYTPSKRLQAENPDTTKNKKVRLEESSYQPNWTFFKIGFIITLLIAFVKILLLLWRNEGLE